MRLYLVLVITLIASFGMVVFSGCNSKTATAIIREALTYMKYTGTLEEVWLMFPDGSGKRIVSVQTTDRSPGVLSPNGRKVLCGEYKAASCDLIEIDLKSGNKTVLLSGPADEDFRVSYSPDGRMIAFSRASTHIIYVMNADGSNLRALTDGTSRSVRPNWRKDGLKIIFVKVDDIAVINPDGTGETIIQPAVNLNEYIHPSFLPNGKIICDCYFDDTSQTDIVLMDADGSNLINLTPGTLTTDESCPTSNAAGTKIAFALFLRGSGTENVYIADFDGTSLKNKTNLTNGAAPDDYWRPCFGNLDTEYIASP